MFFVTKTYGHDLGLSACFRQWKAQSHCRFLHGYALSIKLTFGAAELDENNWVIDFGSLKPIKAWLVDMFDHKMLVAEDDPAREQLEDLATPVEWCDIREGEPYQLADVLIVPAVGCEAFARMIFDHVAGWLAELPDAPRVFLTEVEVREHGANSAIYSGIGA